MNTPQTQPVTGVVRKFVEACKPLATEVADIVIVSLHTLLPLVFTAYSFVKLGEVMMAAIVDPAHAAELGNMDLLNGVINAMMPRLAYTLFELGYKASHAGHDWHAARLRVSEYIRLARIERRRLKYLWRPVRKAATHLVHVLLRFARLKAYRAGLIKA